MNDIGDMTASLFTKEHVIMIKKLDKNWKVKKK